MLLLVFLQRGKWCTIVVVLQLTPWRAAVIVLLLSVCYYIGFAEYLQVLSVESTTIIGYWCDCCENILLPVVLVYYYYDEYRLDFRFWCNGSYDV